MWFPVSSRCVVPRLSERRGCCEGRLPLQFRACSDAILGVQLLSKSIGDCRALRVMRSRQRTARDKLTEELPMSSYAFKVAFAATAILGTSNLAASAAWEPVRPVEFIVPAGTGGGA